MKSRINVKEVKLNIPGMENHEVIFGGAEIEVEYSLEEARGLWELQKEVLKESPELAVNFVEEFASRFTAMEERVKSIWDIRDISSEQVEDIENSVG